MAKWTVTAKRADFKTISARFGIDQVTARLIRNRDIVGDEEIEKYLNGTIADLYDPALLKDCDRAADIILEKIEEQKPIRIIGDYDIDGVMSTYILVDALGNLGADVDYAIPERIKDGYGINENLINKAFEDGRETIITCDNGIAAFSQVERAKELGMTVVVTDHHNVPIEDGTQVIPPADAVIDQKQTGCSYPNRELCGAAVAWKLITRIYEKAGLSRDEAMYYLQFAAFATVGDVVELTGENRIIVKEGLKQLHGSDHAGICALADVCGIELKTISSYHIGFVLGPCLNASGRLDTAERAMKLMLSEDIYDAIAFAGQLKELNEARKTMTEKEVANAVSIIENSSLMEDKVLIVYLEGCHESIAGIIAGRIRERYNRPCIVLTDSEDMVKGSGRSTDEYDLFSELTKVKHLLVKFGGHPKAAGVTLEKSSVDELRTELNRNCTLTDEQTEAKVVLDMRLPFGYINNKLIDELSLLEPFGAGNKHPLFGESRVKVVSKRLAGKTKNVLQLVLEDSSGVKVNAVYFREAQDMYAYLCSTDEIDIAFYPVFDNYGGRNGWKLFVSAYR